MVLLLSLLLPLLLLMLLLPPLAALLLAPSRALTRSGRLPAPAQAQAPATSVSRWWICSQTG